MDKARIKELVGAASGSSQPWFCLLDDDSSWLVKFAGAGPGRDALLAEYVASSLGRLWGLPIPECKPVFLEPGLPRAGTDEFWDVLDASEGWNLAIRTIPHARNVTPSRDLPAATLARMLAYDSLMVNWDRTAMSRNLMADETGALWWIDHGSCRFLHALTSDRRIALPSTHFLSGVEHGLDAFELPMLAKSRIDDLLARVPDDWLGGLADARSRLAADLFKYLQQALGR